MTENEIFEGIHKDCGSLEICNYKETGCGDCPIRQTLIKAEKALEEIQQYRAIGTVEEIQKKMEELERWHTDRINENIKNPFSYTSTSICHNCDHKDEYIEELEAEVAEYKSIGTIEEFKALKEKSVANKPILNNPKIDEFYVKEAKLCPACHSYINNCSGDYCRDCGQRIDWSE